MRPQDVRHIVRLALAEDLGQGDITTNGLIPNTFKAKARLIAKADGIVCGMILTQQTFKTLSPRLQFKALVKDGQRVKKGQVLAQIEGPGRALLSGERVAINFLSFLSGIATKTRSFVDAVKPYKSIILDTRKTTPLLRVLKRYAVRCGGGVNHRYNLNDMAMIKDNHRVACFKKHSLIEAVDRLKSTTKKRIELEVDTWEQFQEALQSKADIILLDNMTPKQIKRAVMERNRIKSKILLEASGGINLGDVKKYAATEVDRISIGELTHSVQALDISLDFNECV